MSAGRSAHGLYLLFTKTRHGIRDKLTVQDNTDNLGIAACDQGRDPESTPYNKSKDPKNPSDRVNSERARDHVPTGNAKIRVNSRYGKDPGGAQGQTRREFLVNAAAVGAGLALNEIITRKAEASGVVNEPVKTALVQKPATSQLITVDLKINGETRSLNIDPRSSLLDTLREHVGLTGPKKGCDHGQCGACTVLADGKRINSCLTFALMYQGKEIVSIEGIAQEENLHPLQAAFIKHDGFQCGYCTPGQICSAVAMLEEHKAGWISCVTSDVTNASKKLPLDDLEIRERMSGNLCRCGAYPGILAAIKEVAGA